MTISTERSFPHGRLMFWGLILIRVSPRSWSRFGWYTVLGVLRAAGGAALRL